MTSVNLPQGMVRRHNSTDGHHGKGIEPIKEKSKAANEEGKNIRSLMHPTEGRRNIEQRKTGPVHTLLKKTEKANNPR